MRPSSEVMPRTASPKPMTRSRPIPFSDASSRSRPESIRAVSSAGAFAGSGISSEKATLPSSQAPERIACLRLIITPRPQARLALMSIRISRRPAPPLESASPSDKSPSPIISPTILVIAAGVRFMLSASRLRDMAPFSCSARMAALRLVRLTLIRLSPL